MILIENIHMLGWQISHALDSKEGEPAERDRGVQLPFSA